MADVDLDDLRCFMAACESRTFRDAARRRALSPGAFSDRIARLEDRVGARLFDRTTRTVTLNDAGRRLYDHARDVVSAADRCGDVAREIGLQEGIKLGRFLSDHFSEYRLGCEGFTMFFQDIVQ